MTPETRTSSPIQDPERTRGVVSAAVDSPRRAPAAPVSLARSRELVTPPLRRAVETLAPAMRLVAGYHFGWLDADGQEVEGRTGKYVRPALAMLGARAVGGQAADAVPAAVAVELVHNFSLLHDDLMDNDEERHHRPTAWKVFGPSLAILGGDAMLTLAEQVLGEAPGEAGHHALALLNDATQELIRGQVEDLSFERRMDVTLDEVLSMVAGKTASLMSCATAVGGVLGGGDEAAVAALADFGHHIGMAFQLIDDLLGIWGTPEVTGKPVLSDIRARKKSVPVVRALTAGGESSRRLHELLAAPAWRDDEEMALAAKLVDAAGGRDWTLGEARRCLTAAAEALDRAPLAAGPRDELAELGRFITDREL